MEEVLKKSSNLSFVSLIQSIRLMVTFGAVTVYKLQENELGN